MDFLRKLPKMFPIVNKTYLTVVGSMLVFALWNFSRDYPTPKWLHKLEHLTGLNEKRDCFVSCNHPNGSYCVKCGEINPPTNEKIFQSAAEYSTMSKVWANRPGKHRNRSFPEIGLDNTSEEERQMVIAEVNKQLQNNGYEEFGTAATFYRKQHIEVTQKTLRHNE